MKKLFWKITEGYVRHALTTVGGAMVAKGAISNDNEIAIIGGILALLATAWSHFAKVNVEP